MQQHVAAAHGLTLEDRGRPVRPTGVDACRDGIEHQGQQPKANNARTTVPTGRVVARSAPERADKIVIR